MDVELAELLQMAGPAGTGTFLFALAFARVYQVVRPNDNGMAATLIRIEKTLARLDQAITALSLAVAKLEGRHSE